MRKPLSTKKMSTPRNPPGQEAARAFAPPQRAVVEADDEEHSDGAHAVEAGNVMEGARVVGVKLFECRYSRRHARTLASVRAMRRIPSFYDFDQGVARDQGPHQHLATEVVHRCRPGCICRNHRVGVSRHPRQRGRRYRRRRRRRGQVAVFRRQRSVDSDAVVDRRRPGAHHPRRPVPDHGHAGADDGAGEHRPAARHLPRLLQSQLAGATRRSGEHVRQLRRVPLAARVQPRRTR